LQFRGGDRAIPLQIVDLEYWVNLLA